MAGKEAKKKKAVAAPKKKKATRKQTRENPGAGHNLAALREQGEEFVSRFFKLNESMESDMAGYKSDIGNLYEEAGNALGIKQSVIQAELKRMLKNKKAAQKEAEMKADERQQTLLWRSAMEGTQFELFAAGDLAASSEVTEANEEDHEAAAEE